MLFLSWERSWSFHQSTYTWPLNVTWASNRIQIELFYLGASKNSAFKNIWSCKLDWRLTPKLARWPFFSNLLKQSPGLHIVKGLEKKMEFLDERVTMSRAEEHRVMDIWLWPSLENMTLEGVSFVRDQKVTAMVWMFVSTRQLHTLKSCPLKVMVLGHGAFSYGAETLMNGLVSLWKKKGPTELSSTMWYEDKSVT